MKNDVELINIIGAVAVVVLVILVFIGIWQAKTAEERVQKKEQETELLSQVSLRKVEYLAGNSVVLENDTIELYR